MANDAVQPVSFNVASGQLTRQDGTTLPADAVRVETANNFALTSNGPQAIATGGTIDTTVSAAVRVTATAIATAVIFVPGTRDGQMCLIYNESAFAITPDIAANSGVADGATAMAANTVRLFYYDLGTALWYRAA